MTRSAPPPTWIRPGSQLELAICEDGSAAHATAGNPGMTLGRRDFLKALGMGGVLALPACERIRTRKALPWLIPPEGILPGMPVRYASTCLACSAACGLLVTTRDGRPVKLEGRASQPISRGGVCALGQADLRSLYDTARLAAPRAGRADTSWARVDLAVKRGLSRTDGKLYLIAPRLVSPSARQLVSGFLEPHGGLLVECEPGRNDVAAIRHAYAQLDGHPLLPALACEQADLIVSLAADFLGTGRDPVGHAAGYAARRRAEGRPTLRHLQLEGTLTLSGAAADERLPATAAERRQALLWLLSEISATSAHPDAPAVRAALSRVSPPVALETRLSAWASEIRNTMGRVLALSGSDDAREQLAVALLNRLVGSEGHCIDLVPSAVTDSATVRAFRDDLAAGRVSRVFFLECDPVDDWPDGAAIRASLAKTSLTVAITSRPTATAAACQLVAAVHHRLERWDDAEPRPGLLELAQPTLRPIHHTRHPMECLLNWMGEADTEYRHWLRERWKTEVWPAAGSGGAFAAFWHEAVRAGQVVLTPAQLDEATRGRAAAPPPAETERPAPADRGPTADDVAQAPRPAPLWPRTLAALTASANEAPKGYEVDLVSTVGLRAGRGTANPWLRELPDPITRTSWMPFVQVAPAAARDLGVRNGDLLQIAVGQRQVELAAVVVPGQHPRVLGLPLGYGKLDGDGGSDARHTASLAALVDGAAHDLGLPAQVTRSGRRQPLSRVQWEASTHGRPIVHQASAPDERVAEPEEDQHSLWSERPRSRPQWHMTVNLDACTGCSACVVACQAENNIPVVGPDEMGRHRDMHWLRIDRYFAGDADNPDVLFEPMMCAQCEHAPCETVCPVAATMHSQDGLNEQVYNRCIGTRYCANNCPYKVRRFNWFQYDRGAPLERMVLNPDVVVRDRGVMEKCTFCVQRIQLARIESRSGEDKVKPVTACQQSCPTAAISFGDITDPKSEVSRIADGPRAFQALASLGIRPSVTYIARVRNRGETPT